MAGNTTRSEATQSFFVFVRDNNTGVIKKVAIPGDVQIGLEGAPAELNLLGRLAVSAKTYTIDNVNKGVIGISNNDTVVALSLVVTPLDGRIRVTLPPTPRDGQLHFIKDLTGKADQVPIDIFPSRGLTIDGSTSKTLNDPFGSLALVWLTGQWRILVAGIGASGGAGGSTASSYITINPEPTLTNERRLTVSSNLVMTDNGPNATVNLNLSQILGAGNQGTYQYATVTVDAFGRVTGISAGTPGAATTAGFLTAGAEPGLPNRRVMSGGLGTTVTDGGAGNSFAFHVDPNIVPILNAANTFLQPNKFNTGLSGSLTQLVNGTAYIIGIGGIAVTTNSLGQVIISGSSGFTITGSGDIGVSQVGSIYTISSSAGAHTHAAYLQLSSSVLNPRARLFTASGGTSMFDLGAGSTLTVSSSVGADTHAAYLQLTSSVINPRSRLLTASGGTSMTDGGPGSTLTLSSSIGADRFASYLQVSLTGTNPQARRLIGGNGISITDAGPGGNVTIASVGGSVDPGAGFIVTQLTASVPSGRRLTGGASINITDFGSGSNVVVSDTGYHWATSGTGRIHSTGSVSVDSQGRYADQLGTDVYFYVSGTIAGTRKAVFGGDVYVSGAIVALDGPGFTGSLTRLATGQTYLVGVGGTGITTNSLGQVLVSSSIGPNRQASYALVSPDAQNPNARTIVAGTGISISDGGPGGSLVITATGTGTGGSGGSSVAANFLAFSPVRYLTSGVTAPVSTAGNLTVGTEFYPTDECFISGIKFWWGTAATVRTTLWSGSVAVATANVTTTGPGTYTSTFASNFSFTGSQGVNKSYYVSVYDLAGAAYTRQPDSAKPFPVSLPQQGGPLLYFTSLTQWASGNTSPVNEIGSTERFAIEPILNSFASGSATGSVDASANANARYILAAATASLPSASVLTAGAGITIVDAGAGNPVTVSSPFRLPIFTIAANTSNATTNVADSTNKQVIGAFYFNPAMLSLFTSGSKSYKWRAIVQTSELPVSAAVDLYDVNGIVGGIPGIITGSVMSGSSLSPSQIQFDLTTQLSGVLTAGIFETRLWRAFGGTLTATSSVSCLNARLEVEFN